ncbi:MAG: helix-turn-helix domain-containing protein [Lentimicrobiaceae bacterium]|nr:helix-turn-helix domain-containing protein [Lentimicrobiaceae bacterium]
MEKNKLIEMRKSKKLSQLQIAKLLNMTASCYSKRECGDTYIRLEEWGELAKILDVPFDEIYEPFEERSSNTCTDNAFAMCMGPNYGTNNNYTVPEALLETQQKYIAKLEDENKELKQLLEKK